jgi:hypothetical protein
LIATRKRQGYAVVLPLDQSKLRFKRDSAEIEILMQRLLRAERQLHEPPIDQSVLKLKLMALNEVIGIRVFSGSFWYALAPSQRQLLEFGTPPKPAYRSQGSRGLIGQP